MKIFEDLKGQMSILMEKNGKFLEQLTAGEASSLSRKAARKTVKFSSKISAAWEESGGESVRIEDIKNHEVDGTRGGGDASDESAEEGKLGEFLLYVSKKLRYKNKKSCENIHLPV